MADTANYRTDGPNTYTTDGNEYLMVQDNLPDKFVFNKQAAIIGGDDAEKKVVGRSDVGRIQGSGGVR